ncbi:hypothetical protein V8C37DRAFT_343161 [Trichoderma ceciliae]
MMPTNTGRRMLPLHSLLNPASPGKSVASSRQFGAVLATSSTSSPAEALRVTTDVSPAPKTKSSVNVDSMTKPKPQGPVNFAPFEDIDQASYREMCRFRVSRFGQIRQSCEHIPYNSSKKDFFEKTGRESIEVFKYEFRLPGEDTSYTVMWDYNVGLVRMTPFFKCLGYPKTKPSQMLDKNPGLRDISPSVTGGAVSAQGYWMPYRCARAVCATFCIRIAGALIPLFGPSFPSACTSLDSPQYKEMVISPRTIIEATEDVERFRHGQRSRIIKAVGGMSSSIRVEEYALRGKQESQVTSAFRLPSRSHSFWTPINGTSLHHRPVAVSAPSTTYQEREVSTLSRVSRSVVASRSAPGRSLFQVPSTFFNGSPRTDTSEPEKALMEKALMEKWRPKRRRRGRDEPISMYSPAPSMEVDGGRSPQQELEHFKAAAALVSLQREMQDAACSSAAVVESSDDDFSERRHQKKRPKAHSF